MTSRRRQITLRPDVLRWARERANLSPKELADKMKVALEAVTEWEQTGMISVARADNLATKTYTPLGYLYLPNPLEESLPIRDFRTRGDKPLKHPSTNLLDTVYVMQRRQNWMRDDLINGGANPLPFVGAYTLEDDFVEVAVGMRTALSLLDGWAEDISSWTSALRFLRDRLDNVGVLVVSNSLVGNNRHRKLAAEEFQGFALVDKYAPLVFVNSADFIAARIFTLVHEVAHVFVGEAGLSAFDKLLPSNNQTEKFCNRVAAEFLVPQKELQDFWSIAKDRPNPYQAIARKFKVSAIVAARRLLDLGYIDQNTFLVSYEDFKDEGKRAPARGSGGNFWNTQRWRLGTSFAGAVARATREGRLLDREAYSLTGLKRNSFENMSEGMGISL